MRIADLFEKLAGPSPLLRCHRARDDRRIEDRRRTTDWLFLEHAESGRVFCSAVHSGEQALGEGESESGDPLADMLEVLSMVGGVESCDARMWGAASTTFESAMQIMATEHDRVMKLARSHKPRRDVDARFDIEPPGEADLRSMRRIERQLARWIESRQLFWTEEGRIVHGLPLWLLIVDVV